MNQTTLQYRVSTSRAGYRRVDQALLQMGLLANALVQHRKSANSSHRGEFSLKLQTASLTDLHRNDPEFNPYARRLLEGTARRVNKAFRDAYKRGVPRPSGWNPHRNDTLEISEPANRHLRIKGEKGTIHIKGLPKLTFNADHRLPENIQPRVIRITRKPRRLVVSLVFHRPFGPALPAEKESVGIDPGKKFLATTVDETSFVQKIQGHDDQVHRKETRRLNRKLQRQRDAALRDGRAKFVSQKTKDGKTKRRFRWEGKPSRSYLRTLAQLRRVEQKKSDSRNGFQHRLTTQLVKTYQTICIEDTKTHQMTKSAKGTAENPGKNVRQKSGLNREILAQGWYGIRSKLEYKCLWNHRSFVPVPAPYTSLACPECGSTDKLNRLSRDIFKCTDCGHTNDADVNAAENIRRRGNTRPGQTNPLGVPPEGSSGEIC